MKIGEINKIVVNSGQILLANGIRYFFKKTGFYSFLDFRLVDERVSRGL